MSTPSGLSAFEKSTQGRSGEEEETLELSERVAPVSGSRVHFDDDEGDSADDDEAYEAWRDKSGADQPLLHGSEGQTPGSKPHVDSLESGGVAGKVDPPKSFLKRNEGLMLIIIAQASYSAMSLFFQLLNSTPTTEGHRIGAMEVIMIRMGTTWVGCVAYLYAIGEKNALLGPPEVRKLLALRGIVGYGGLFSLYYSLQYLSLSDATVITFLSPLATGLLGFALLGESFGVREIVAGLVSIVGVLLIARPTFLFGHAVSSAASTTAADAVAKVMPEAPAAVVPAAARTLERLLRKAGSLVAVEGAQWPARDENSAAQIASREVTEAQRLVAVGVALLGVLCMASSYTTIRAIGKRASPWHVMSYLCFCCAVMSGLHMVITGTPFVAPSELRWVLLLACCGIFGLGAQVLTNMGLQREKAGRATTAVYTQVVWSALFQVLVMRVPILPLSALGCLIILAAALFVALSK